VMLKKLANLLANLHEEILTQSKTIILLKISFQ